MVDVWYCYKYVVPTGLKNYDPFPAIYCREIIHNIRKEIKMNFETLLQKLHEQRKAISQNLDDESRRQLVQHLESYISSGEVSDDFFTFCGKKFPKLTDSKRIGSKDKEKLTQSDVKKFINDIIEASENQPSKSDKKEKEKKALT